MTDLLPGGRADGKPDSAFNPRALRKGRSHEREHTKSPRIAGEIAKDHLVEDPDYYEELAKMEGGDVPYVSTAQQRFFHTPTAKKKGISAKTVKEYDDATKGSYSKLPEHAVSATAKRAAKHGR